MRSRVQVFHDVASVMSAVLKLFPVVLFHPVGVFAV